MLAIQYTQGDHIDQLLFRTAKPDMGTTSAWIKRWKLLDTAKCLHFFKLQDLAFKTRQERMLWDQWYVSYNVYGWLTDKNFNLGSQIFVLGSWVSISDLFLGFCSPISGFHLRSRISAKSNTSDELTVLVMASIRQCSNLGLKTIINQHQQVELLMKKKTSKKMQRLITLQQVKICKYIQQAMVLQYRDVVLDTRTCMREHSFRILFVLELIIWCTVLISYCRACFLSDHEYPYSYSKC